MKINGVFRKKNYFLNKNKHIRIILTFLFTNYFMFNVSGQESTVKYFEFWSVGNSINPRLGANWYNVFDELEKNEDDFYCLLNTLSKKSVTKEEIRHNCNMSFNWLNSAIDSLLKYNCIGITSYSKIYPKLPIMKDSDMLVLQEKLKPISIIVAEKIKKSVPLIKEIYNQSKSTSGPEWDEISHFVIDKLLIDGYFHRNLSKFEEEKGFKKYYSSVQQIIPVFFLEGGGENGTFGVNWYDFYGADTERHVYVLHGGPFMRYDIRFNKYGWDSEFAEVILRIGIDGNLEKLSKEEIQIFKKLEWVEENKLIIPFIQSESLKAFKNEIEQISVEAAEQVFDNFSVIMSAYEQSQYSNYPEGAGDFIQVCYHSLFAGIINELIDNKTLASIPEPTPEAFGVYITIGNFFD